MLDLMLTYPVSTGLLLFALVLSWALQSTYSTKPVQSEVSHENTSPPTFSTWLKLPGVLTTHQGATKYLARGQHHQSCISADFQRKGFVAKERNKPYMYFDLGIIIWADGTTSRIPNVQPHTY